MRSWIGPAYLRILDTQAFMAWENTRNDKNDIMLDRGENKRSSFCARVTSFGVIEKILKVETWTHELRNLLFWIYSTQVDGHGWSFYVSIAILQVIVLLVVRTELFDYIVLFTLLRRALFLTIYIFCRSVVEGGPAHAKRFTYSVRVLTTTNGWTQECQGEPMPSVKKAKDSAALLLLAHLKRS